MLNFLKYQHIERYNTIETEGIELGECYIFPKIDGTNAQVWYNDGKVFGGSRNRVLDLNDDNGGFYAWLIRQENIIAFVRDTNYRLYGEWMIPHTIKYYTDTTWNNFYVFDVLDENNKYLHYEEYSKLLDKYNIKYIPPICKMNNPESDSLFKLLEKNFFLIKDGYDPGEGIVIKNYSYTNRYGRMTWAKIVRNDFKTKHIKVMGVPELYSMQNIESKIVDKYITEHFVLKEYNKIVAEMDGWSSKFIPRLLQTVFYSLIKEESWSFVKENKNPIIDFKKLNNLVILKIKLVLPEVFS